MVKVTVVVKVQKLVDLENVVVMMINVNRTSVIMLEILMEVPVVKVIPVISVYLMINVKVVFVTMVLVDIQMENFGRMIQINGDGIKILVIYVLKNGKRNLSLIMVKVIVVVKAQKLVDSTSVVVMMINVNRTSVIMLVIPREVPVAKVIPAISVYLMINVSGICDNGTCRYPNQGIWEDDPNKWRWDKNLGNLCAIKWEKKFITHNGKVTVVVKVQKLVDLESVVVMMINVNRTSVIMLEIPMEVPVVKVIPVISVYLMINVKVVFAKVINVDIPIKEFGRMIQINGDGIMMMVIKNVKMDGKRNLSLTMVKAIVVVKDQSWSIWRTMW